MGYMTNGLTFNALRDANLARLPLFKDAHGRIVHNERGDDWTPAQWLQALIGEIGEYANLRKKFERGDIDADTFLREGERELADIQIYLDILAYQVGVDLGRATIAKFNAVSERIGCSVLIREDGSDWYIESPKESRAALPLRCPFCGAAAEKEPWHGGGPYKTMVSCSNEQCPAQPRVAGETPALATKAWNTRFSA